MVQAGSISTDVARSALERLKRARMIEPDALHPQQGDVVRFVQEMQQADTALAEALVTSGGALDPPERAMLGRRRASVDAAIARQASLAARRMGSNRKEALETLDAMFKLGSVPDPPINGSYRGQFLTSTILAPLDSSGRFVSRLYMPWQGKRLDAHSSRGINVFSRSMVWVGRLYWPAYSGYRRYREGLVTGFPFHTYTGAGERDPEITTLKLDYNLTANPRFIVRSARDELVQVSGGYYLGKAYLRRGGSYRLVAFFALQKEVRV